MYVTSAAIGKISLTVKRKWSILSNTIFECNSGIIHVCNCYILFVVTGTEFLNQACAAGQLASGFLKLFSCGHRYVCVSAPQAIKNCSCEMKAVNKFYCFQFLNMALGIDTINGHGLSNKAHHKLIPKKAKITQY